MSGINVKMGVSGIAQFKDAMSQGKAAVKALDAELKLNAAQYKQSGDKEEYLRNRTDILNRQIKEQERIVKAAQQALAQMTQNGADPASTAYQNMQAQVMSAQASLVDMQTQLSQGTDAFEEGTDAVDEYADKLNSIDKNVSFQSTIQGLQAVKGVAQTVISTIKGIASAINESANWADETSDEAAKYDMTTEEIQRIDQAAQYFGTTGEEIRKMMDKVYNLEHKSGSIFFGDYGIAESGDLMTDFFNILEALNQVEDKEVVAQQIFGKSWRDLNQLMSNRDKFFEKMEEAEVVSQENMDKLTEVADKNKELEDKKNKTQADVAAALADDAQYFQDALMNDLDLIDRVATGETSFGEAVLEVLGNVRLPGSSVWNMRQVLSTPDNPFTPYKGGSFWSDTIYSDDSLYSLLEMVLGSNGNWSTLKESLIQGGQYTAEELENFEELVKRAAEDNALAMVEGVEQGADAAYAMGITLAKSFIDGTAAGGSGGSPTYYSDGTYIGTVNVNGVSDPDTLREQLAQEAAKTRAGTGG